MAKSLKLRISRVITTSFQSCRSKDPSILPQETVPVPSSLRLSAANHKLINEDIPPASASPPSRPPPPQHQASSSKRHVSSGFVSFGCGFTSKPDAIQDSDVHTRSISSQECRWQKEEKWHVVASLYEETQTPRRKIYNRSASGDSDNDGILALPPPLPLPSKSAVERKKRRGKKKRVPARFRSSTSSADTGVFGFSSEVGDEREEEEETEILMSSSRSFSTDSSSEINSHLETMRDTPVTRRHKKTKIKAKKRSTQVPFSENIYRPSSVSSAAEGDSPARLSVFKKLIPCSVDGKVSESFAIMKKSKDPYEDFKRSMMEMILEKHMFEEKDLEQLLQCFLSLNSKHHHGLIVEAFTEIWEAMFSSTSARTSIHHGRVNSIGF